MRTTITIADDVHAEMERLRPENGIGPSEALNTLARHGMTSATTSTEYVNTTYRMGPARVDVANIGDVLALLATPTSPGSLNSAGSTL